MNCADEHDPVRFQLSSGHDAWVCVQCSKQIGTLSNGLMLPQADVDELVAFARKMRVKHEAQVTSPAHDTNS